MNHPDTLEPQLELVEPPLPEVVFKYEGEGLPGQIIGATSTGEKLAYPSIRIKNFTGTVFLLVSPVNTHLPHRQHPHKLVPWKTRATQVEIFSETDSQIMGLHHKTSVTEIDLQTELTKTALTKTGARVYSSLEEQGSCENRSENLAPNQKVVPENADFKASQFSSDSSETAAGQHFISFENSIEIPSVFKLNGHILNPGSSYYKAGVFVASFLQDTAEFSLDNLGLVITLRKNIESVLSEREKLGVDPFQAGFSQALDLNLSSFEGLRLCFQVYLSIPGTDNVMKLEPVVSEPILDCYFLRKKRPRYKPVIAQAETPGQGKRKIIR